MVVNIANNRAAIVSEFPLGRTWHLTHRSQNCHATLSDSPSVTLRQGGNGAPDRSMSLGGEMIRRDLQEDLL